MKAKPKSAFSLDELGRLFNARVQDDLDYLKDWSKKAVTEYEAEMDRLCKIIDKLQTSNHKATENEN